jgi:hypothetical protein
MESGSTLDRSVDRDVQTGTKLAGATNLNRANLGLNPKEDMQQESSTRTSQASISAALAAANAALRDIPSMNLARPDSGRSLAEMAQRDLDAALQLLTDRAQYITGSSGAAIALRRSGTNDMLCRASTGSNAPELGTLLSTEFGLSGESVRTRRALRCDDAERDARVNHDVCREVGIASVVVMPVVHDDEVLGVFELFSGKAHAFGERDMSALQRLSEMVETAVRLAQAAEGIPERWKNAEASAKVSPEKAVTEVLEADDPVERSGADHSGSNDSAIEDTIVEVVTEAAPLARAAAAVAATTQPTKICIEPPATVPPMPANTASAMPASANPVPAKRPLLWSAVANLSGDAAKPAGPDQSHVPPAFRNLRKCEACGFPVSAERTLCVECEEKKWRGQLKPRATAVPATSGTAAAAAPAPAPVPEVRKDIPSDVRKALAIAASAVKPAPAKEQKAETKKSAAQPQARTLQKQAPETQVAQVQAAPVQASPQTSSIQATKSDSTVVTTQTASPTLVFSAAMEPSQSWLARNKYVLGALLVVAGSIAAILLLR